MTRARLRFRTVIVGLLMLAVGVLTACNGEGPDTPGQPTTGRPFTLATTAPPLQLDPALAELASDQEYLPSLFQTLMTAEPGGQVLKPDAAKDCVFESEIKYSCTLEKELTFSNGHRLTSSDVKFSILRAIRLDRSGERTALLSSVHRIDTPDQHTVDFILSEPDSLIGWGLASPAAAIVDEESYDADQAAPPELVVGSGPLQVTERTGEQLVLTRHDKYQGSRPAALEEQLVIRFFPDSASVEEAMSDQQVDAAWNGLSTTARARLRQQIDSNGGHTDTRFTAQVAPQPIGTRLIWSPNSSVVGRPDVRAAVRDALQEERIADSIVPSNAPGYVKAFRTGGLADPPHSSFGRVQLTLGHDPRVPDQHDLAQRLRDRMESAGGLSVRLVDLTQEPSDIRLLADRAPFATAFSWLAPAITDPGAEHAVPIHLAVTRYRSATEPEDRNGAVATLQRLAAGDATVVPVSFDSAALYIGPGFHHDEAAYGPNGQLGLWGFTR